MANWSLYVRLLAVYTVQYWQDFQSTYFLSKSVLECVVNRKEREETAAAADETAMA